MNKIEACIATIGEELVNCSRNCLGITCDTKAGIPPRCLILESGSAKQTGCIAIGINPGRSKDKERSYYRKAGVKYQSILNYWQTNISEHPYYERLRKLLRSIGLTGPILWSELAKCETAKGQKGLPPLSTLRTCTREYLSRELASLPENWPLIAVGKEAYKALAYRYPTKTLIGIPHPTGAYGDTFSRHLPGRRSHASSLKAVKKILARPPGGIIWLGNIP